MFHLKSRFDGFLSRIGEEKVIVWQNSGRVVTANRVQERCKKLKEKLKVF
jgi:hypothetical protein